jgi:hypothetical protein
MLRLTRVIGRTCSTPAPASNDPTNEGAPEGDVFDEEKARRDATNNFALAWLNSQKLAASIGDWRQQECSKNAPVWATVDVEAVFKNDLGIPQYPPLVLLQLDVLPFYELIIKNPAAALQQYGHRDLPHVAFAFLSFLGRHASNAASEGCHSVAKLLMSDKRIAMSPTILSQFAMLRHSAQSGNCCCQGGIQRRGAARRP